MLRLSAPAVEHADLLKSFSEFRSERCFCDVTLQSAEGTHFRAHRVILAAASKPLAVLMNNSLGDSQAGVVVLTASSIVIDVLLRSIYEGFADIPLESSREKKRKKNT